MLVAAKSYYFGVGGGVQSFTTAIKSDNLFHVRWGAGAVWGDGGSDGGNGTEGRRRTAAGASLVPACLAGDEARAWTWAGALGD